MQQNYQDAMAIVGRFGKPSIFLTYTCNPGWREIREVIEPTGMTYQERPDIVCRVFNLKFQAFMDDIQKYGIFGHCVAFARVVEFQKRGLPHCHCTFWFADDCKITNEAQLDALICAELPDPVANPRHDIVKRSMIHGPCGFANSTSSCMKDGLCSKHFPKPFCDTSILNPNGYSTYRRRDNGRYIQLRSGFKITNEWIVPYNPYLSLRYNCHINIEICSSLDAIKYLYKYMYKGADSANIVLSRAPEGSEQHVYNHNEITQYLAARYVSSMEAMWRILQFKMHEFSHRIYRLGIHLPNDEPMIVHEPLDINKIKAEKERMTMIKGWFELNKKDPEARKHLYTEIAYHYVWQKKEREWTKRQRGADKVIPRLHNVSPRRDQLYFLRVLLLHVRGCQSFEDVRTVDGIVWPSFKEAAIARNLVQDDTEWYSCMREAVRYQMPAQLRSLFVCLNVCQTVHRPIDLLSEFYEYMIEDFVKHSSVEASIHMMLNSLSIGFARHEKTMKIYGLPEPNMDIVRRAEALLNNNNRIEDHFTVEQHASASATYVSKLNADQRAIYDRVMSDVDSHQRDAPKLHFIDGPGGCGKTFLFQVAFRWLTIRT